MSATTGRRLTCAALAIVAITALACSSMGASEPPTTGPSARPSPPGTHESVRPPSPTPADSSAAQSTPVAPSATAGSLSKDDAVARVVAFLADPSLTGDLSADGPNQGASWRWYDVRGSHVGASVDADTGAVISLLFLDHELPAPKPPTSDDAISAAEAFLSQHGIPVDGMTRAVEKLDHGETWEWVVRWSRSAGGVTLPDSREVGVDQAGRVWRFSAFSQAYSSPPPAKIDQATAEAAAIQAAFPDSSQTQIERAELKLKVDAQGNQRLVWEIQVTGWVPVGSSTMPIAHAFVEVDAETGTATVVGRG